MSLLGASGRQWRSLDEIGELLETGYVDVKETLSRESIFLNCWWCKRQHPRASGFLLPLRLAFLASSRGHPLTVLERVTDWKRMRHREVGRVI